MGYIVSNMEFINKHGDIDIDSKMVNWLWLMVINDNWICPLVICYSFAIEDCPFCSMIYLLNMVMFNSKLLNFQRVTMEKIWNKQDTVN